MEFVFLALVLAGEAMQDVETLKICERWVWLSATTSRTQCYQLEKACLTLNHVPTRIAKVNRRGQSDLIPIMAAPS